MPIPRGQLGQMANPQFSDPRQNQNLAGFPAGAKPQPMGGPQGGQYQDALQGLFANMRTQPANPMQLGRPPIPPGGKYPGGFPPQRMPIPPGRGLPQPGMRGTPGFSGAQPGMLGPQGQIPPGMSGIGAGPQSNPFSGMQPGQLYRMDQLPPPQNMLGPQGPQTGPMRAPLPGQMPPGGAGMGGQQKPPGGGGMQPGAMPGGLGGK